MDYYAQSITLMKRVGNHAGQADVYKMMARLYLAWKRVEDAIACAHTSLALAERMRDELRMGGSWYVLAGCHEELGQDEQAARFLQRVVRVDRKYGLPKLEENTARLQVINKRLQEQLQNRSGRSE